MTFKRLRMTGPERRPYVLGAPMDVYDGDVHVGCVLSVTVSSTGNEVRLEDFLSANLAELRSKQMAKLILAEIVTYFSENYPQLHAIGVVLSRDIEGFEGREAKLATVRSEMLQSIGAENIRITPKPHALHAGHFAVSGVWQYNNASVRALATVLETERAAYRARGLDLARARNSRSFLARLFSGRK